MDSGREALAELIDDIRVSSPHDTKSHSSPIPKPNSGFRQQVSVHPHPEILPLDPDEDAELLSLWNNRLLPMMRSIVHDALIEESYSVALVRQKEPDGSRPIIRFRSTEGQGEIARQIIRERVKDICTENGIHGLDVQFTEGSLVRLAGGSSVTTIRDDPSNDSRFPHQRRPWGRPGMGASIGPGNCPHISATLGGYVSVSGAIHMLSVEHFMDPSVKRCCAPTVEVRSPSIGDISVVGRAIEKKLKALTLEFTNKTQGGMSLRQAESLFSGTTDQELDLYSQYKRDLCGDFSLGKIKHMSHGPRIRKSVNPSSMGTPHRMDWSLFKAEAKHREGHNKHRFRRISQPPLNDLLLEAVDQTGAGALCDTTGDLRGREKVHYAGTTSGFREGYVNPARIQLNYDGNVSEEWSMITNDCQNSRSDDFEGDSGAWIISDDNKLLGLLWGWDNGSLIFTPIKDVFEDISEKTRLRNVRLPVRPGSRARGQTQLLCRTTDTADHSDLSIEDESLVPQEETKSEIPLRLLETFESGAKSQRRRSSSASSISNISICSTPSLSSAVSSECDRTSPGTPFSPGKVCSPSANRKFRNFVLSIRPRAQSVSSAVSEDWVHIAQEDMTIKKPSDMARNELQQPNTVSCVV
ncbi:hypothetical protein BS50DRAFT_351302 [Corynespora cassiicola Philippines]|uniref:Uncharacterized protein n=1 Tax=Corynespora cassiicola Philippines TaxID=1448308 RepID=A0A2T2NR91_CORCC|nr:hypothetical protein BS50DRAFT_351302 [Corynespora cassiicola Philippines]